MLKKYLPGAIFLLLALCTPLLHQILDIKILSMLSCITIAALLVIIFHHPTIPVPLYLTLAISILYGFAPLVDIAFLDHISALEENTYYEVMLPILYLFCSGLVLANVFNIIRYAEKPTAETNSIATVGHNIVLPLGFLLATTLYFGVTTFSNYGLIVGTFTRAEIYSANNLAPQIARYGTAIGTIYIFNLLRCSKERGWKKILIMAILSFSFLIFLYANIFVLGDRRIFISLLLAVLLSFWSQLKSSYKLIWFIPVSITLWIYSFLRDSGTEMWLNIVENLDLRIVFNPANGEFGAWIRIAQDILSRPFTDIFRPSILTAPLSLIPSSLYPDRPFGSALWYVNEYDPATASKGGAWAFSLPIEGYMNLWFLGPFLFGLAIGLIIIFLSSRGPEYVMLSTFVFAFSFRADLVSLLQTFLVSWSFLFLYKEISCLRRIKI